MISSNIEVIKWNFWLIKFDSSKVLNIDIVQIVLQTQNQIAIRQKANNFTWANSFMDANVSLTK